MFPSKHAVQDLFDTPLNFSVASNEIRIVLTIRSTSVNTLVCVCHLSLVISNALDTRIQLICFCQTISVRIIKALEMHWNGDQYCALLYIIVHYCTLLNIIEHY